ncbi:DUF3089 domain-containing protein [Aurantiacibacter poecillastricola]|uniref:DUF3089 domain-containing protein n=1 Tax=Aurantiacibacter poecillastricola TaxID=3064385 RepID=UPI00273EA26A|nr:DUF3089 domain-containing protein [Aurantiacibacter sp. 219JJ12-13]MDP5261467.1 DUF3089 domain-containing protein [Aurantiacibacter sp. 219JJ12-13]
MRAIRTGWRATLRKFLYTIVFLILLVLAGLLVLRVFAEDLTRMAMVPDVEFTEQTALQDNAYQDPAMWFSRPGKSAVNDPARWQPAMAEDRSPLPTPAEPPEDDAPPFAVFFVHPTSFLERDAWNAPLDHQASQDRAQLMSRGMASAFNRASEIWVPRYRQATYGAFLTDAPEAGRALDAAYADIAMAFDFFVDSVPEDMPIVLAGHSQGGYHVVRLLAEKLQGSPLLDRIAVAYPVGIPISLETDLPQLNLPACATARQAGCIVSWASFAEPAETDQYLRLYNSTPGLDGQSREGSAILCVNPLTGNANDEAEAARNLGTLVPESDLASGELVPGAVPARCDPDTGVLLIGDPPELGEYVLPGNNYHVYDIPLFWRNLQEDVVTRVRAWQPAQPS